MTSSTPPPGQAPSAGCRVIELPKILDRRGNLTFIEKHRHVPFAIARTYWLYDVPGGQVRGGHAYHQLEEFIVALSGSFDVVVDDGESVQHFMLNRSYLGLHVPRLTWRHIENFSTNAVCLILASRPYEPDDYLYDYDKFVEIATGASDDHN
jgi:hypothetical protein